MEIITIRCVDTELEKEKMQREILHLRSYIKETKVFRILKRKIKKKRLVNEAKLDEIINTFITEPISEKRRRFLHSDIKEKADEYGFPPEEYFLFGLEGKPEEVLKEFVSDFEHVEIAEKMNKAKNQAIFDDKALTYKYFKQYYQRTCVFAECSKAGAQKIRDFCEQYGDFIMKPIERAGGNGIEIVHKNDQRALELAIDKLLKCYKYGVFIEQLIKQDETMKQLHPQSVNTVRIPTIRVNEKETIIFHPFLRIGRGEAVVDNAGSGGIICALDKDTGIVVAARDEYGKVYETHPESNAQLLGFQVHKWKEAIDMAKKLAQVIPTNRYTGWDLALTENGWIMVEGNARGQFVWQYVTLEGCRSEIRDLFNRMDIKFKW